MSFGMTKYFDYLHLIFDSDTDLENHYSRIIIPQVIKKSPEFIARSSCFYRKISFFSINYIILLKKIRLGGQIGQ